jgi:hypothetical protein
VVGRRQVSAPSCPLLLLLPASGWCVWLRTNGPARVAASQPPLYSMLAGAPRRCHTGSARL